MVGSARCTAASLALEGLVEFELDLVEEHSRGRNHGQEADDERKRH